MEELINAGLSVQRIYHCGELANNEVGGPSQYPVATTRRTLLHHQRSMPFGTFVTCLTQGQGRRNGRCCTYRPIHRTCHFNSLLCHTHWSYPSRSGRPSGPRISVPRQCPWEKPSDGSPMTRADGTALLLHLHRPLIRFTLVHHATSPAASPCMTEVRIKVWLHTESMVQPTAASFIERRLEQFFKLMHKLQVLACWVSSFAGSSGTYITDFRPFWHVCCLTPRLHSCYLQGIERKPNWSRQSLRRCKRATMLLLNSDARSAAGGSVK
ncbi:hypothetical protein BDP55DRAFT_381394 [Colletotrichum godetiae]|uniref:Uncharacterized protein n=1 Tax=Colletotrichum godetiae TaxID=1209918 RepID=A0AAJ0AT36_9PEZI|nr:uncharacterized protein BDP55DRAFT_381394 [Colletotrichum godetiae]KAK1689868.1 hypothetical protein BDP55DRAFT_381394 [Colletotrichum godetiae]